MYGQQSFIKAVDSQRISQILLILYKCNNVDAVGMRITQMTEYNTGPIQNIINVGIFVLFSKVMLAFSLPFIVQTYNTTTENFPAFASLIYFCIQVYVGFVPVRAVFTNYLKQWCDTDAVILTSSPCQGELLCNVKLLPNTLLSFLIQQVMLYSTTFNKQCNIAVL